MARPNARAIARPWSATILTHGAGGRLERHDDEVAPLREGLDVEPISVDIGDVRREKNAGEGPCGAFGGATGIQGGRSRRFGLGRRPEPRLGRSGGFGRGARKCQHPKAEEVKKGQNPTQKSSNSLHHNLSSAILAPSSRVLAAERFTKARPAGQGAEASRRGILKGPRNQLI
jgi:hypothetical protein